MQHLAQPTAEGFAATTSDGMELYGALCPLPKRLQHLSYFGYITYLIYRSHL